MKDGKIVQSGKYEDLVSDKEGELICQMAAHTKSLGQVNSSENCNRLIINGENTHCGEVKEENFEEFITINYSTNTKSSCQQEKTETGRVKWHVYSTFITSAYKGCLVPVILLCQVLFQALQMASNYWIAWGTEEKGTVTNTSNKQLIGIFVLLSAGSSIFILGRAVLLSTIAIETARRLFLGMTNSVFRAPLSFFDSTPSSRILSRVSTQSLIQIFVIILTSSDHSNRFFLFLDYSSLSSSVFYRSEHSRH